jgi:hypothetical protein
MDEARRFEIRDRDITEICSPGEAARRRIWDFRASHQDYGAVI